MKAKEDILLDPVLLTYLDQQSGVEIHLSDTHFTRGCKVRVFWRGDEVAEADDVRTAINAAKNRIARTRDEEEHGPRVKSNRERIL